jgi:hypothetical protein
MMAGRFRRSLSSLRDYAQLPAPAKAERRADRKGVPPEDPGIDAVVREGLAWLARAQDNSRSRDGGVARDYSLIDGWNASYPETTGYIVPTFLEGAVRFQDDELRERARRMLDWLVEIQLPGGGFQGGVIGETPVVPVTFNTGQILIGLAAGVETFGDAYLEPMRAAATQLVESQDPDGCWRQFPSPFAKPGEKSYETHVAWGLYEAARQEPDADRARAYAAAATANVEWALGHQRPNGWFGSCCLAFPDRPLTHTLGYVLRGVLEAHRYTDHKPLLEAARRTGEGLLSALQPDGWLPGRLDDEWNGRVPWVCLTGSAQVAHCWLVLYRETGDERFRDGAYAALSFVRRTVRVEGPEETRGAVKGPFPITGAYGPYTYLNWACKFLVDACNLEADVRAQAAEPSRASV